MNIEGTIRQFIVENFLMGEASRLAGDKVSFLDSGIVDSTGVLELVTYVEETFGIAIEDDELLPENLDSIVNLANFVRKKKESRQPISQKQI
ncbi:MAG: acyl carrier protein [candidate division Zixibacteria bacterium CG_4_9_14_3_um_filter_46_8]|nr:MAG: acyl carrier protein [candidate division Zixibacteria bacterium CG_4_9_14_3_um_filter_46_8]